VGRMLTLGKAAIELRCSEHHLRTLADRERIPVVRAGKYRLFDVADFPAIRAALIEAGYLPKPEAVEVAND
jgi:hypothetical protein